jgi:hypothetical protein
MPVRSRRVVGADADQVVERHAGVDPQGGVVAVAPRGDAARGCASRLVSLTSSSSPGRTRGVGAGEVPLNPRARVSRPASRTPGEATSSICSLPSLLSSSCGAMSSAPVSAAPELSPEAPVPLSVVAIQPVVPATTATTPAPPSTRAPAATDRPLIPDRARGRRYSTSSISPRADPIVEDPPRRAAPTSRSPLSASQACHPRPAGLQRSPRSSPMTISRSHLTPTTTPLSSSHRSSASIPGTVAASRVPPPFGLANVGLARVTATAQLVGVSVSRAALNRERRRPPIAAGVFEPAFGLVLRPEIAALSMSGSSLLVAVNALLLKRLRLPRPPVDEQPRPAVAAHRATA